MLNDGIQYPASSFQQPNAARKNVQIKGAAAFALYEVLLGVTIFVIGVLALGRSVQNCLNASALSAEEDRVRPAVDGLGFLLWWAALLWPRITWRGHRYLVAADGTARRL